MSSMWAGGVVPVLFTEVTVALLLVLGFLQFIYLYMIITWRTISVYTYCISGVIVRNECSILCTFRATPEVHLYTERYLEVNLTHLIEPVNDEESEVRFLQESGIIHPQNLY